MRHEKCFEEEIIHFYANQYTWLCGHQNICKNTTTRSMGGLNLAKQNVERYFSVVGIVEDMATTYSLLEGK